ncbi:putative high-affinity zinc uptake system ATP-binding component of ABC transporter protein [Candidatus Liberibacter solanacearum CLso-ZC1]|uniref:Putative high-affinity zinc uptake system ATP-binding component of ABC transporter protein n=1 Tax=Liberibacter solanacearum (strain CLso-ZC1) TaxID=658172 RepID=E4UBZ4_LIBSC|nr:metal ABC transporter ATP-binding protein [Candidatus Liberibacter solanacearum]ADR51884.1 putative high-affinity zinc uptake system ATP-binding component of ABC transporter protein [Candidatus Liberibacter solanacearum CLso-ZC1]
MRICPSLPLISLANTSVHKNGIQILHDINFTIKSGEIVTLIGPNGSGKSTIAKLITGIIKPSTGNIIHNPKLIIGYVPQKVIIENTLPLSLMRFITLTTSSSQEDIIEILKKVNLNGKQNRNIRDLSGGEFQRALLAKALLRKPNLLVLDEPLQGIDFPGELTLYELISSVRQSTGCGILLISHNLHMVMASTDTVICLNNHICYQGPPQTIKDNPEYIHLFGSRATEILAIHNHKHVH